MGWAWGPGLAPGARGLPPSGLVTEAFGPGSVPGTTPPGPRRWRHCTNSLDPREARSRFCCTRPRACSTPSHETTHRSHTLAGRRFLRRLDRLRRQPLLLLEVLVKRLEVEVVALHLLSTLSIELVDNGVVAHWGSPNSSSGVQIYGSVKPKPSQIRATRGKISAFAM